MTVKESVFARWGRRVYRWRWATLAVSIVLLAGSLSVLLQGGSLGNGNAVNTESARASKLMAAQLPSVSGTSFNLLFGSTTLSVRDSAFRQAMTQALAPLRHDKRVTSIDTPYSVPAAQAASMESRDGKYALVNVNLKDDYSVAKHYYPAMRASIHSKTLQILAFGALPINQDFNSLLNSDLQRGERVSLPLALLLLLLVFGTVVAALLPLGVGLLAMMGGLAGVYLLTNVTDVSQYALNVVTLIGLGVAIDYSLFIVSRFREELAGGSSVEDALARAMATAGRAITFSGLTVAIGLVALLFFQGTFLASMGAAGGIVVACAVVYALTFLPAMLALLGHRVNWLQLPFSRQTRSSRGMWLRLANGVMKHPIAVLAVTLPVILLVGAPFLNLHMANTDITGLPPQAETHRAYDVLTSQFPNQNTTQISIVVDFPDSSPLSAAHVGALYDLGRRIAALPHVQSVQSAVTLSPSLSRQDYQTLYSGNSSALTPAMRTALHQTVGAHIALLTAITSLPATSDQARTLVQNIRALAPPAGGQILVTGQTASDIDTIALILGHTPSALAFVMVMTYIVLFLLLGSVILPLKAVLTDVLSISASFGALVWIFQEGHLHEQFNFTPASIDPTVPVLLFCIVFGLSMDYEVLLLSRVKEEYDRTGDARQSVADGLERSGRLITGAAAIMVVVFGAFALADTVVIKAIGMGMAIAVAVDATVVRALMVPAIMRLLGRLNWWAPRPLVALYERLNLGEMSHPSPPAVTTSTIAEVS